MPKDLVLIVEDNPAEQAVLTALAKRAGVRAHLVASGREALVALRECSDYSMIFMDCKMVIMDGLECARRIRRSESQMGLHIPIVAITALDYDNVEADCKRAGMDEFLHKPFRVQDFDLMIKRYCISE